MGEKVTNVVVAGLGGQGVLKATDIIASVAFDLGNDVKKAEVHGMSQRGGSVTSDVRFGRKVLSPMVSAGHADYLVVLDDTQIEPTKHMLKTGGVLLNAGRIDIKALSNAKALNTAMLGMLSAHLPFPESAWLASIRSSFPEKLFEANKQAFGIGRSSANKER
ncbi:MAG: pyruvate ferredoxin oxidoreductase [Verrucomicrobia bacterium]|nr:pyruvate ferredoxin oxidoreductase [Verrucomicrobiota bacterium]